MTVNWKRIIHILGVFLFVNGINLIPSFIVGVIYKEYTAAVCFMAMMMLSLCLGRYILSFFKREVPPMRQRDGFLLVSAGWLLISLLGALPYMVTGVLPLFADAFFESCAGYSTCGMSVIPDVEALPRSILFYRALSNWIGGMGLIVLGTALLPTMGIQGQMVAKAEVPGISMSKLSARYSDTSRILYLFYLALTAALVVLLWIGPLNLYEALVYAFGTVGTGGFCCYNDSAAHFGSYYVEWVLILFMFISSVNFNLSIGFFRRKPRLLLRDEEFRFYGKVVLVVSIAIMLNLMLSGQYVNAGEALTQAVFNTVSVSSTTGLNIGNYNVWPTFSRMLLLVLFFMGACSSSTGGGVKQIRILVGMKLIHRGIARIIHPNIVSPIKFNGIEIKDETSTNVVNFLFFYIGVLVGGMVLLSFDHVSLLTSFSAVLACLSNVGLGFGSVSPVDCYAGFTVFSKLVLAILMIAGRLELYNFFLILSPHYWNSDRY